MDNETLFYICGGIAAISAVLVTFAGLKLKGFPGRRLLPLVVVWFAVFAVGSSAFAVRYSQEEHAHKAHELEQAGKEIEEGSSGPFENEAGALGGESEELEEQAEEEAGGSQEEEPVGPTEGSQQEEDGESKGDAGASATTTLQLAADPTALLFDKEELTAKAGKVTIEFDNPSAIPHNVVIEDGEKELAGFEPITEGEESLSADLDSGSYDYVCTVPGHEEAGMVGILTVE